MSIYVVGDIQGCASALEKLLTQVDFQPGRDTLWVAGDLVNRGPDNLGVLRFIKGLGDSAVAILGNHDLHLLGVAAEARSSGRKDTIQDVINAPDCDELLDWLRHRPLLYQQGDYVLSHAGVPHIWTVSQARARAKEVEATLRSDAYPEFLQNMYGNQPNGWQDDLSDWARLRVITNYFTRMRLIDVQGQLDFDTKDSTHSNNQELRPWFEFERQEEDQPYSFLFGHWAALEGRTGLARFIALDTGCVWGGCLTMMRLEDQAYFRHSCDRSV